MDAAVVEPKTCHAEGQREEEQGRPHREGVGGNQRASALVSGQRQPHALRQQWQQSAQREKEEGRQRDASQRRRKAKEASKGAGHELSRKSKGRERETGPRRGIHLHKGERADELGEDGQGR